MTDRINEHIAELAPEYVRNLAPYQPGKPIEELERELGISGAIKIASNENPMGPSPRAVEAAARALADAHMYPDGSCHKLRHALAARLEVEPEELVFGCGSDEIIGLIVRAFCRPGVDEVLTHEFAFVSYRLYATAHGVPFVAAPVTESLRCDIGALVRAMTARTRVIFLANPNNPTGAHLTREELERVLEAAPARAVVVVDEAYHEYATARDPDYPSSAPYRGETRPLLITLRTFSKIYGLAGLRVGYGIGDRRVIDFVNRVRGPFNVNSVAQAAALAALDDAEHVRASSEAARTGIAALTAAVTELGLRAYPSLGNFVLFGLGRPAGPVYQALLERGVIVRPMTAWGLPEHIRVTVGAPAETERVVAALASVLG